MPTSLPALFHAEISDRTEFGLRIGTALILTWAVSLLFFSAVTTFGAETAAFDSFELLATF